MDCEILNSKLIASAVTALYGLCAKLSLLAVVACALFSVTAPRDSTTLNRNQNPIQQSLLKKFAVQRTLKICRWIVFYGLREETCHDCATVYAGASLLNVILSLDAALLI